MKQKLVIALGLIVFGMVAFAASPATAINGNGYTFYPIPPSWGQTLPAYTRFVVLLNMNSEAVLDKETGLVWEKSPSTSGFTWKDAQSHCNLLTKGNRMGWRVPTLQELESLVDPSMSAGLALPAGHPFSNVNAYWHWSATTDADDSGKAWEVHFMSHLIDPDTYGKNNSDPNVWCVRGGQGVNPQ